MKLISCYIENFGNLSEVSYTFDSNITSFYHENGFGKSTLASFIKAMFYGLESYKSSTVNFVDRMHYYPFNKKAFGGNLTFEYLGKTYKIERFFDEKSETKDTFKLYVDGNLSDDFNQNIGEAIFEVDKKSFERLLFVTDEDIEIKTNSSINSKLNTLLEGRDDTNLEEVLKELDKVSKTYKDSSTKASKVRECKEIIKILNENIINQEDIINGLDIKYKKLDELKKDIAILKDKQFKSLKYGEYKANLETYNSLVAETNKTREELDELNKHFTKGVISKVELDVLKNNLSDKKVLMPLLKKEVLTPAQQLEFEKYSELFSNDKLSEENLNEIEKDIQIHKTASEKINVIDNREFEESDLLLEKRFNASKPSEEKLEEITQSVDKLNKDLNTYQSMESIIHEEVVNKTQAKPNKIYFILAIVLAFLALVSIPVFFLNLVAGIIVLAISIIGLLVDGFMYLNNKQSLNTHTTTIVSKENTAKTKLKNEIDNNETLIKAFFIRYGYECENGVTYELAKLKDDIKKYEDFMFKKQVDIDGRKGFVNVKENQETKLNEFFNKFKVSEGSYVTNLNTLRKQFESYKIYLKLQRKDQEDKQETLKSIKEKDEIIESICNKYDFEISTIEFKVDEIATKANKILELEAKLTYDIKKVNEYKDSKNITEENYEDVEPLEEINENLDDLDEQRISLTKQIDEDEFEVSSYHDNKNELEKLKEKIKYYKEKYDIFDKTMFELKKAEQNLKDKYIGPVKEKFIYYAEILEKALGDKLSMSKDFEIYFERNGQLRSEKHLSSGLKSICALCFRLALLDNMYLKDKPFIILDDPFVLLDENHLLKTKEIIKVLSKDIQIVYFTCHNSRKI